MAAKTYRVQYYINGIDGAMNDKAISGDLRTELFKKFKRPAEIAYSGTLSGDFQTITTTKEFTPGMTPVNKSFSFTPKDIPDTAKMKQLNTELRSLVTRDGATLQGSMQLVPPPAPKEAPKAAAPTAAPPVVTSTGPKTTYTLGFQVNCAGTFQRDGGIKEIFGGELDAALLKSFRERLKKLFPDGEYGKNDTTFATSGDVPAITMDRDEEGHNKLYIESLLPEGPLRTQLTDSMSCGEDENTGEILLLPITGGKRRKTRRSTRRKRTTRRR